MRSLSTFLAATAFTFGTAMAQIPAQNASGIGIGHVHFNTADPDALGKVLVSLLGATEGSSGSLKTYKLPGLFMMVFKATPTGPSDGSAANHVGFVVKDYADIKAKLVALGAKQAFDLPQQKQMMYEIADGIRMEFFEDPAIPTTAPVTFHHMHLSVPDPDATGAWYVKVFGAEAGTRRNLPAAKFPGGEVDFIKAAAPRGAAPGTPVTVAPSKGRSIDHIGFEVKNLKAFTDKLEADGIPFDMEYRDMSQQIKLKIAFIVDPVGTRIELTEGLAGQ